MIDFPNNPTVGQQFTAAGVTWTFDGAKWTASGLSVAYLPLAGGTMSGPIVLAADPTANLQAATKQYVDGVRYGDNRIINGDMRIDQRNNGGVTAWVGGTYVIDRWQFQGSQTGKVSGGRNVNSVTGPAGFPYYLGAASQSAYTVLAGDYFYIGQSIEADFISDLAWGTANAQPVTLSFWAQCTLTGTFGGAINNNGSTRSYPFTFSIPTAGVWTKIVLTISGDTAGTWTLSGNGTGLSVHFDLGSGATFRAAAGAWASANYVGATGSVNLVGTNGACLYVTGVKLEIGSVATSYNRQSLAKSMTDCQRYYGQYAFDGNSYQVAGGVWSVFVGLPVTMRATPTLGSIGTPNGSNTGAVTYVAYTLASGFKVYSSAVATGGVNFAGNAFASAEL